MKNTDELTPEQSDLIDRALKDSLVVIDTAVRCLKTAEDVFRGYERARAEMVADGLLGGDSPSENATYNDGQLWPSFKAALELIDTFTAEKLRHSEPEGNS
jgi:hypothetical protein